MYELLKKISHGLQDAPKYAGEMVKRINAEAEDS